MITVRFWVVQILENGFSFKYLRTVFVRGALVDNVAGRYIEISFKQQWRATVVVFFAQIIWFLGIRRPLLSAVSGIAEFSTNVIFCEEEWCYGWDMLYTFPQCLGHFSDSKVLGIFIGGNSMAQVPPSPWSRWDAPGYQYVSNQTKPPLLMLHDAGFEDPNPQVRNETRQRLMIAARLLDQKRNQIDANFVDCIYGIENSPTRIMERCLASTGCCETACCKNRSWQEKYAWAIALLAVFCILVLISLSVTLFCWLYNRARDKHQKQLINESMGEMSPAVSQANMAALENRNESGYYPYVGGPNHY
uniref:Uncharacterized protein n=1 Tax=Setaria digitata TaxID=48799 RepID=A0A915PKM8_9BILA